MITIISAVIACTLVMVSNGQEDLEMEPPALNITGPQVVFFNPPNLTKIVEATKHTVEWYTTLPGAHHASYKLANSHVASVVAFEEIYVEFSEDNNTVNGSIIISADFIGFNSLNITIYDENNETLGSGMLGMSVLLAYQKINTIFTYILSFLIGVVYINMGATIDLSVVKQIVKKPFGPLIGILCQYIIMPLIAFGLAKMFFPANELLQLGLFLNGASPGGGASNMWTLLMGGSLDLSIMMTFASTIFAFGAVPLWVLTLGPQIIKGDSPFVVPYKNIAMTVVTLVVPCSIGLLIQRFFPKFAKFIEKHVLAKFSIFNLIFIFTFGVYSYRYIFLIFNWKILLAGFLLPGLGYLSGLIISFLCRRSWNEIIAISIETGVQNATIAIIILKFTVESPASELAVVMPACMVMMTPLPLVAVLILKKTYQRLALSGNINFTTTPESGLPDSEKKGFENGVMPHMNISVEKIEANKPSENGFTKRQHLEGVDNPVLNLRDECI